MTINIKKIKQVAIISGVVTAGLLTSLQPAMAGTYRFNKYIGKFYIGEAKTYRNRAGGTTAEIYISTPKCNGSFKAENKVTVTYSSPKGGWFKDTEYLKENSKGYFYFSSSPGRRIDPDGGNLNISTNSRCIPI